MLLAAAVTLTGAQAKPAPTSPVKVSGYQFLLRGKPFCIISDESEYTRIPREYWKSRFQKAHAIGLNTVKIYVL